MNTTMPEPAVVTRPYPGMRFTRWTLVAPAPRPRHPAWDCVCDCGAKKNILLSSLVCGISKSCGCLRRERLIETHTRHGMYRTSTYRIWDGMIGRCTRPAVKGYQWYGARGVTVCKEWFTFANFLRDMGERPPGMSLDRIDPTGNYEPTNCRWATSTEQARNKRVMKMTAETVVQLRTEAAAGARVMDLANSYGISSSYASHIILGRYWADVEGVAA